jgi:hypothetical protein
VLEQAGDELVAAERRGHRGQPAGSDPVVAVAEHNRTAAGLSDADVPGVREAAAVGRIYEREQRRLVARDELL